MKIEEQLVRRVFKKIGKDVSNCSYKELLSKVYHFDKMCKDKEPELKCKPLEKIAVYMFYNSRAGNKIDVIKMENLKMKKRLKKKEVEIEEIEDDIVEEEIEDDEDMAEDGTIYRDVEDDDDDLLEDEDDEEEEPKPRKRLKKKIEKNKNENPKSIRKRKASKYDDYGYRKSSMRSSINKYIEENAPCSRKELSNLGFLESTLSCHLSELKSKGLLIKSEKGISIKKSINN